MQDDDLHVMLYYINGSTGNGVMCFVFIFVTKYVYISYACQVIQRNDEHEEMIREILVMLM